MGRELFDASTLYDRYRVMIALRDRLYGGAPKDPELIAAWVKARTGHDDELTAEQIAKAKENLGEVSDEIAEASWNGFYVDQGQLWIPANNVKACLKQSASMLGVYKAKRGSKQVMAEGLEVKATDGSDRIMLGKSEPDGRIEKPIHVMTAQGPRNALKRADYVEHVKLSFEVWVLTTAPAETRHIGEKDLVRVLTFAQENGIGADRSQGAGKFDVVEFSHVK